MTITLNPGTVPGSLAATLQDNRACGTPVQETPGFDIDHYQ